MLEGILIRSEYIHFIKIFKQFDPVAYGDVLRNTIIQVTTAYLLYPKLRGQYFHRHLQHIWFHRAIQYYLDHIGEATNYPTLPQITFPTTQHNIRNEHSINTRTEINSSHTRPSDLLEFNPTTPFGLNTTDASIFDGSPSSIFAESIASTSRNSTHTTHDVSSHFSYPNLFFMFNDCV